MASETLQPTGLSSSAKWTGAVTNIDEGTLSHDSDATTISVSGVNQPVGLTDAATIDFADPTITGVTEFTVNTVFKSSNTYGTCSDPIILVIEALINGVTQKFTYTQSDGSTATTTKVGTAAKKGYYFRLSLTYKKSDNGGGVWSAAEINSLQVRLTSYEARTLRPVAAGCISGVEDLFITAVDVAVNNGTTGQPPAITEAVQFSDSFRVDGSGVSNPGLSISEEVSFSDAWAVGGDGAGGSGGGDVGDDGTGNPIDTGRTDMTCRSCGTFARVTEALIVYADGFGVPVSWDGISNSVTDLSSAKVLQFVAASRGRLALYGEEPYNSGTVTTIAGNKVITTSASWAASLVGKTLSINGVTFGESELCSSVIKSINGTAVTLTTVPNHSVSGGQFIVYGGSGGSVVQLSNENDHATFDASAIPVGQSDGDISTGLFALDDFLVCTKRGRTYRVDWADDFSDVNPEQVLVTELADAKGCVGPHAGVVREGQLYLMDFCPPYFWATRGARGFWIDLGLPVTPLISPGGDYELDFTKSFCWPSWWSPIPDSICWACTLLGEPYPRVVFEYFKPQTEGGEEPGRWSVRVYHHYVMSAENSVGSDGVCRAWLTLADRQDPNTVWIVTDDGKYGDMATHSASGTVTRRVSPKVLDLGHHVAMERGAVLEIDGEEAVILSTSTDEVTLDADFSFSDDEIVGKTWRGGWRAPVTFRTIHLFPEPGMFHSAVEQVHCAFAHNDGILELSVFSDEDDAFSPTVAHGEYTPTADVRFTGTGRLVSLSPNISGYNTQVELRMQTPDGTDMVYTVDIVCGKPVDGPHPFSEDV